MIYTLHADLDRSVELGHLSHYTVPIGIAPGVDISEPGYAWIVTLSQSLTKRNLMVTSHDVNGGTVSLLNFGRWNYTITPGEVIGAAVRVKITD